MTDETTQTEQSETEAEVQRVSAATELPKAKRGPRKVEGMVKVRITKAGDGKVFTGKGDETFARNDAPLLPKDVAEALEARGLAEID